MDGARQAKERMTPPSAGQVDVIDDGIRRILAPNPGPMTLHGTNTWLLGESEVAVIDPGPDDKAHLAAILAATKGQKISHILVTHAHADHSPLARRLSLISGAPVYGYGAPEDGRSPVMTRLATEAGIGGGEGVDGAFRPDLQVREGDTLRAEGWSVDVLHTPGHFAGHLSFQLGTTLFSGDHVMGWATTLVSPPDGDLGAFLRTSKRLATLGLERCLPGHGDIVAGPEERLTSLISHRQERERQILEALGEGIDSVDRMTARIYHDVPSHMHPAAARNILAHLIDLDERNVIEAQPSLAVDSRFKPL